MNKRNTHRKGNLFASERDMLAILNYMEKLMDYPQKQVVESTATEFDIPTSTVYRYYREFDKLKAMWEKTKR